VLFIRYQPAALPLRGDFLVIVIFRLLQLAPVGHERAFAVVIVLQIYFRAGHGKSYVRGRAQMFVHFLTLRVAFAAVSAAPFSPAPPPPASCPTAGPSPAITAVRIFVVTHMSARIIAFVAVEHPIAQDALPCSWQRPGFWCLGRRYGSGWWRWNRSSWSLRCN